MLRHFRQRRKGQTSLEYTTVFIIVIGALIAMSNYIKRSLAGRWKSSVDDVGPQYDPRYTNAYIQDSIISNQYTQIYAVKDTGGEGYWTFRMDDVESTERKTGQSSTGAY